MTVIKWKPTAYSPVFSDFWNGFYKDFSNFAGNEGALSVPAVNILENAEGFKLEVAAPGLKKEDFKINLEKNIITISAQKEENKEETKEKYTRKEFSYQNFKRSFQLPELADYERIEAHYDNGILNIIVPKKDEAKEKQARTIEIK